MKKIIGSLLLMFFAVGSSIAQVKMYYPDYQCGKIDESDVSDISVTYFLQVKRIEFIYKAKVVNERGMEVLELISDVVSCDRGRTDYTKEEIKGLRVLKKEIDFANYSGSLTFYSKIVHPVDTSSIIATIEKTIFLKNGIAMTDDGKYLTDPNLFEIDPKMRYGQKFELDNLYKDVVFKNKNNSGHCLEDLKFIILQDQKEIYNAELKNGCFAPGENAFSESQKRAVVIKLDKYEFRNPKKSIQVQFKNGENIVLKRTIESVYHFEHGLDYDTYTNQSIGLSFDFINEAKNAFFNNASNGIVFFKNNGEVQDIEMYPYDRTKIDALGINSPFGSSLSRPNFNGLVSIHVLRKDQFTDEQWLALVAYANGIKDVKKKLRTISSAGLEIVVPEDRIYTKEDLTGIRDYSSYTFVIKDQGKVLLIQVGYFSNVVVAKNTISPEGQVDINRVLNSFNYNNINLQFQFNDSGKLQKLELVPVGLPVNQEERRQQFEKFLIYDWVLQNTGDEYRTWNDQINFKRLDSLIVKDEIREKGAIPMFKIITPKFDSIRKYASFEWDSVRVEFSHRIDGKPYTPFAYKMGEDYFYNTNDKIEYCAQVSTNTPDTELLKKYKKHFRFSNLNLLVNPVHGQQIMLSRINRSMEDDDLLKAIVAYENSNQFKEAPVIQLAKSKGWKVYVAEDLINAGQNIEVRNVVLIDSGVFLYRVKISGGFKSDIKQLLNSLKIEGKQLHFEYDDARKFESFEIK